MVVLQITKGTVIVNIKLKNARKKAGLTQEEVAKQAGITTVAYQRYEAGKRVPNAVTAILIADALGVVDLRELFEENKTAEGKSTVLKQA